MLLWEEAFSSRRQSALPSNLLYFEMVIPDGDAGALNKASNSALAESPAAGHCKLSICGIAHRPSHRSK